MDIILLAITIVSLVVALVMSVAAWRLTRDEKQRSAARVAALSLAANSEESRPNVNAIGFEARTEKPLSRAPWAPARAAIVPPVAELPLNQPRVEFARASEPAVSHASGFLGAAEMQRDSGSRQKSLAFAAVMLFVVLSGGLFWMMSGPRGTTAAAVGPNSPLELVSLSHQRQNEKLAVSGLVRNPANGKPIDHLSAVVFLFDKSGTFVTSSKANVDFLKLGAGDETPFVVSLDAPPTVARYRVSFRTDEGIVPHIDRRSAAPAPVEGEQPVNVTLK
jgi:flagellar basal body-associated protein FliL